MFYKVQDKPVKQLIQKWALNNHFEKSETLVVRLLHLKFSQNKIQDDKFKLIYNDILLYLIDEMSIVLDDSCHYIFERTPKWKTWNFENLVQVTIIYLSLLIQKDIRNKVASHAMIEDLFKSMLKYDSIDPDTFLQAKHVPIIQNQALFEAYIHCIKKHVMNLSVIDSSEKSFLK